MLLGVLLAISLVHSCGYALTVTPWQAPDEPGHFEHARILAESWRILRPQVPQRWLEQEIMASLYANRYWDYVPHPKPADMPRSLAELGTFAGRSRPYDRPSLSYVPYAAILYLVRHQDVDLQLRVARLLSAFYLPLTVWLTWAAARLLFPLDLGPALVASSFTALLPQHAYILGSVNDGNLAELFAALFFYLVALLARRGASFFRVAALGLSCLLALLCKTTALSLLPAAGAALLLSALAGRVRSLGGWLWVFVGTCLAGMLVFAGARFGPRAFHVRVALQAWQALLRPESYTAERVVHYWTWVSLTYESFWARFGWMAMPMPSAFYRATIGAGAAAFLGLILRLFRPGPLAGRGWLCLLVYATGILASCLIVWGSFVVYYSPYGSWSQGRYLFPSLLPTAVLIGYGSWASSSGRFGRYLIVLWVVAALAMAAYAFSACAATFK